MKEKEEKLKIKRPKLTLLDKILPILKDNPNITPKEISELLNVRITSIHAVLRKVKCNDYRKHTINCRSE